jgi:hypothetical protein
MLAAAVVSDHADACCEGEEDPDREADYDRIEDVEDQSECFAPKSEVDAITSCCVRLMCSQWWQEWRVVYWKVRLCRRDGGSD